jgi:hypothetical protein
MAATARSWRLGARVLVRPKMNAAASWIGTRARRARGGISHLACATILALAIYPLIPTTTREERFYHVIIIIWNFKFRVS